MSIEPQKAIVLSVIVSFHKITNTILGISYSTGEICPICETAGKSTAIVEACLTSSGRHSFIDERTDAVIQSKSRQCLQIIHKVEEESI